MRKPVSSIGLIFLLCVSVSVLAQDDPLDDSASPITVSEAPRSGEFSSITQTSPTDVRSVPQKKIEALQKDDDYWYANLEPEKKTPKRAKPVNPGLLGQEWFWNLLWILALCGFIAAVVWYLSSSNIRLFRKKAVRLESESEEGPLSDDIFSINYEKEIRKAEEGANYGLALRLWYLYTLKELADRNLIDYRPETPNGDYVNALFSTPYYRDFFRLTRVFEYAWYGQFDISGEVYQTVRPQFLNFKTSLSA